MLEVFLDIPLCLAACSRFRPNSPRWADYLRLTLSVGKTPSVRINCMLLNISFALFSYVVGPLGPSVGCNLPVLL